VGEKSNQIRKNFAGGVKKFHNLKRILGLDWASGGKIGGAEIKGL